MGVNDYTLAQQAVLNQMAQLAASCVHWSEADWSFAVYHPDDLETAIVSGTLSSQAEADEMRAFLRALTVQYEGIGREAVAQAIAEESPGSGSTPTMGSGDVAATYTTKDTSGSDPVYELTVPGETGGMTLAGGGLSVTEAAVEAHADSIINIVNTFTVKMENAADALINPSEALMAPAPGSAPVPVDGTIDGAEAEAMVRQAGPALGGESHG